MFGSQEIQKLMYKDKLVYQNGLPVGTILFEGDNRYITNIILTLVKDDWSNIKWGVEMSWSTNGLPYTATFSKKDLLVSQKLSLNANVVSGYIIRVSGKNELNITRASNKVDVPTMKKITVIDKPV